MRRPVTFSCVTPAETAVRDRRVRSGGGYDDIGRLGVAPWVPAADAFGGNRTAERPAPNVVVRFP